MFVTTILCKIWVSLSCLFVTGNILFLLLLLLVTATQPNQMTLDELDSNYARAFRSCTNQLVLVLIKKSDGVMPIKICCPVRLVDLL